MESFNNVDDYISNTNEQNQVISDNFYYQPFSYDVISEVPVNTWESTVSNLNHISGFQKFGTFFVNYTFSLYTNQIEMNSSFRTVWIADKCVYRQPVKTKETKF